jgi:Protein of unknown function (DUF616)
MQACIQDVCKADIVLTIAPDFYKKRNFKLSMKNFVVYTAITRGYDDLKNPPLLWAKHADFFAFMDQPQPTRFWKIIPLTHAYKAARRNAKIYKVLPHLFFPTTEYSLWLDGSVKIKSRFPLEKWAAEYLTGSDIAVFRHRTRDCIYKEALTCISYRYDKSETIHRQMQRYFDSGYPAMNGLAECTVIFRRHTKTMKRFNEMWYKEIQNNSSRDQLSFDYVAYKLGVKYNCLPGDIGKNPHFNRRPHLVKHFQ